MQISEHQKYSKIKKNTPNTKQNAHSTHRSYSTIPPLRATTQKPRQSTRSHSPFGRLLDLALIGARDRVASLVARLPRTRPAFHGRRRRLHRVQLDLVAVLVHAGRLPGSVWASSSGGGGGSCSRLATGVDGHVQH